MTTETGSARPGARCPAAAAGLLGASDFWLMTRVTVPSPDSFREPGGGTGDVAGAEILATPPLAPA
jgi:hypothetical protein